MKKNARRLLTTFVAIASAIVTHGQAVSINQNFDVACVYNTNFPAGWLRYNPIPATFPKGAWTCNSDDGRDSTPCLQVSGYYDNTFHVDTAYLITPMLNLADYAGGSVYLQFDTRTSNVVSGSSLSVFVSYDDVFTSADSDLDTGIAPHLTNIPDTNWSTHQVNLTGYETNTRFFIGFRYISNASYGSAWYIDNVRTSKFRLGVPELSASPVELKVLGPATKDHIAISYSATDAGKYDLLIYDMMGRIVRKEVVQVPKGTTKYSIKDIDLQSGIYCIKIGSSNGYDVAKFVVQ